MSSEDVPTVFEDRPLRLITVAGAIAFAAACGAIAVTGGVDRPADVAGPLLVGTAGASLAVRLGRSRLEVSSTRVRVVTPLRVVDIPSRELQDIGVSPSGPVFVRRDGSSVTSTAFGTSPWNVVRGRRAEADDVVGAVWERLDT